MAGRQKLTVNQIADDLGYERAWNLWEKKDSDEWVPFYLLLMHRGGWNLLGTPEGAGGVQRTGEQIATVHDVAGVEGRAADPVSPLFPRSMSYNGRFPRQLTSEHVKA